VNDQFPPIVPPMARDFDTRASVTLLCEVRQGSQPWKLVHLEDISQTGFRIAVLPEAALGLPLRIKIPGLHILSADIRWQKGKSVGCEFAAPLHVAVFEHILQQVQFNGPLSR
jgi:PilZ domain